MLYICAASLGHSPEGAAHLRPATVPRGTALQRTPGCKDCQRILILQGGAGNIVCSLRSRQRSVFGQQQGHEAYGGPVMPQTSDKEAIIDIKPLHVLLLGAGVLGSGVLLTASVSYKQAGKQLAAEGIDAGIRRAVLPHALKALSGSLLLTGLAAAGGFYVMESLGVVNSDAPTSTSAFRRAWGMVAGPLPREGDGCNKPQQQQQSVDRTKR